VQHIKTGPYSGKTKSVHFEQFGAIDRNTGPLSDDLRGENKVLQNLFVDIGEGSAARPLLLDTGRTGRLAQHPALSNKDDMTIGEFLFELTGEPVREA